MLCAWSGSIPIGTTRSLHLPAQILVHTIQAAARQALGECGRADRMQDRIRPHARRHRRATDRRTFVRDPQGLDVRHPLPDPGPSTRSEPEWASTSWPTTSENDHDLRCQTADGGDQHLIAPLKPHAPVCLSVLGPYAREHSSPPSSYAAFSTASGSTGRPPCGTGTTVGGS